MFCAREHARRIPTPGGVLGSARAAPDAGSVRFPRGESGITGEPRQGLAFFTQVFHSGGLVTPRSFCTPGAPLHFLPQGSATLRKLKLSYV